MRKFAADNGIHLASGHLYMGPRSVAHALRENKSEDGKSVPDVDLVNFVTDRKKMDLYWDGDGFVYTDYVNKFVVKPNYKIKVYGRKERKVNFITAGIVTDASEFNLSRYKKV